MVVELGEKVLEVHEVVVGLVSFSSHVESALFVPKVALVSSKFCFYR